MVGLYVLATDIFKRGIWFFFLMTDMFQFVDATLREKGAEYHMRNSCATNRDFCSLLLDVGRDFSEGQFPYFRILPILSDEGDIPPQHSTLVAPEHRVYSLSANTPLESVVDGQVSFNSMLKSKGYVVRGFFQEDGLQKIDPRPTLAKWAFDIAAGLYDHAIVVPGDFATRGEDWRPVGWSHFLYVVPSAKLIAQLGNRTVSGFITPFMEHSTGGQQYIPFR